jgi:predicted transposase YbfD/YdcC
VTFSQIPHHRSFAVFQSVIPAAGPAAAGPRIPRVVCGGPGSDRPGVAPPVSSTGCDLLELLAKVPDGRPGQGRDHPVAVVLALAAAAVVAGMRSFTAIAGWAADVPAGVLAELYERGGSPRAPAGPPSKATIWRVVTGADAPAFDAATGAWLMARAAPLGDDGAPPAPPECGGDPAGQPESLVQVRVDGKTVRGAKGADGSQVHLLAAMTGEQGLLAAQTEVGAKTNEIPMIIPLLDGLDLAGTVITADALHCQRATADYLHQRGAEFVLPVKDNQPGLFDALDTLRWQDVPVAHAATDRGHGRITTRTIQVLPAPEDLPFPHVSQAYLIERHVTALDGTPLSDIAALGVTSLTATRAPPPAWPASSAASGPLSLCTGCDTLYREDDSTVRTRSGPRAMAALRNLAIGALRLAERHDTTEATRWASRYMDRRFTVLGVTS